MKQLKLQFHDWKQPCMQEHLYRHFSSRGQTEFLNDVLVTLTDKTYGSDHRLLNEDLKTISLYGVNTQDSVYSYPQWIQMFFYVKINHCSLFFCIMTSVSVLDCEIWETILLTLLFMHIIFVTSFLLLQRPNHNFKKHLRQRVLGQQLTAFIS